MTITDIIKNFAFYGFTETPLTAAEMDQCISWGFDMDTIYGIGCDCANGYTFRESVEAADRERNQLTQA